MILTQEKKKKCTTRLSKIYGQLKGLERMIVEDRGVENIFQQATAIKGSVNSLMNMVLKEYMEFYFLDADSKEAREEELAKLLALLKSYFKQDTI